MGTSVKRALRAFPRPLNARLTHLTCPDHPNVARQSQPHRRLHQRTPGDRRRHGHPSDSSELHRDDHPHHLNCTKQPVTAPPGRAAAPALTVPPAPSHARASGGAMINPVDSIAVGGLVVGAIDTAAAVVGAVSATLAQTLTASFQEVQGKCFLFMKNLLQRPDRRLLRACSSKREIGEPPISCHWISLGRHFFLNASPPSADKP